MWPTDLTFWLLIAGGLAPVAVILQGASHGWRGLVTLRCLGVVLFWVGYHLSPLLSYISGDIWDTYLLVPEFIDEGLLFSSLCMWAFIVGCSLNGATGRLTTFYSQIITLPRIKIYILLCLIVISFSSFIFIVGGLDDAWRASYMRGQGQFDSRDLYGKVRRMATVLGAIVFSLTALFGSMAVLRKQNQLHVRILGGVAIAVSMLKGLHWFSRAAGYPLAILGLVALLSRGRKGAGIAVVCFLASMTLGTIGYNGRGSFTPGVGNYLEAAFNSDNWPALGQEDNSSKSSNTLDAMAPWTRKVQDRELDNSDQLDLLVDWLINLNPLPSELVPVPPVGRDLAEVMGTWGQVGLTTPAFAEIYYVFGRWGAIVVLLLGVVIAFFERLPRKLPGGEGLAIWAVAFLSFPLGLHSGCRAMTRPLVYGLILVFIVKYVSNLNKRKSSLADAPADRSIISTRNISFSHGRNKWN